MQSFPASPTAPTLVVSSSDEVAAITIDGLTPDQSAHLFLLTVLGHKGATTIAKMNVAGNPGIMPLLPIAGFVLPSDAIAELATVTWIASMRAIRDYLAALPDDHPNAVALAKLADMFATGSTVQPEHGEAAYQAMTRAQQEARGEFTADQGTPIPTGEGSDDGGPVSDEDDGTSGGGLDGVH